MRSADRSAKRALFLTTVAGSVYTCAQGQPVTFDETRTIATDDVCQSTTDNQEAQPDYFVKKDGVEFAGTHLIVDLYGATGLQDPKHIEAELIRAAKVAGATVLSADFHVFSPNNGVSGVIVLAESHISIHTWPERDFAAVDVFMCGACNPLLTISVLKDAFTPDRVGLTEIRRGLSV